jgi:4,5-dihydroxyphthalate decarboxylase
MSAQTELRLTTVVGARGWRERLQKATADVDGIALDFLDVSPIHRAFAPMAREQKFDISEMAVVTALQALAYGKPILLLPVTVAARFQHRCLIAMRSDEPLRTAGLSGRRIGVRAYTQTTGVWVRGILQNDYGVAAETVRWVTQEGAHVAEYRDPDWVERTDSASSLPALLRQGEIDAAIFGNDLPDDPDFVAVIENPESAAQAWFAKHGVVPLNHMLTVRKDIAAAHAPALQALWQAIERTMPAGTPLGIDAHRKVFELLITYCDQQKLLPRRLTIDEIFEGTRAVLGDI